MLWPAVSNAAQDSTDNVNESQSAFFTNLEGLATIPMKHWQKRPTMLANYSSIESELQQRPNGLLCVGDDGRQDSLVKS